MATVLSKVPPPPPIAVGNPTFNRWLLDLTSFINAGGGINPDAIPGYDVLLSTVATHTTQINTLIIQTAANTSNIAVLFSQVAALSANSNAIVLLKPVQRVTIPANSSMVCGRKYIPPPNNKITLGINAYMRIL